MYFEVWDFRQVWCSPYGYTKNLPENYKSILAKSQVAVDAIAKVSNVSYKVGTCANIVLQAPGSPVSLLTYG